MTSLTGTHKQAEEPWRTDSVTALKVTGAGESETRNLQGTQTGKAHTCEMGPVEKERTKQ
jgi:hypothetical protein